MRYKFIIIGSIFILIFAITLFGNSPKEKSNVAMTSISSDGRYVLTTHYGRFLVLWDIKKKQKKIINTVSNIYSPYFIPNTTTFLWQDANTNEIYMQSIKGTIQGHFNPGFSIFGQVFSSNFKQHIIVDKDSSLYRCVNNKCIMIKRDFLGYSGGGKLFALSLKKKMLLTVDTPSFKGEEFPFIIGTTAREVNPMIAKHVDYSLLDGIVLWDAITGKPVKKFIGLSGKSVADLSLDNNYVIGADEQSILYVWETKTGKKLFHSNNPVETDFNCCGQKKCLDSLDELIQTKMVIPADFYSHSDSNGAVNVAVKFIDEEGDFIRFIEAVNYGTLYNVNSPKIRAYMPLGTYPKPDIYDLFSNANIIDTAPKANILVMGQQPDDDPRSKGGTGIIVYHFNKKTKQLERIWAPEGPPPHHPIQNNDNHWEQ